MYIYEQVGMVKIILTFRQSFVKHTLYRANFYFIALFCITGLHHGNL